MFSQLRQHFCRKVPWLTMRQLWEIPFQYQAFFGEPSYIEVIGASFEKGSKVDKMIMTRWEVLPCAFK